MFNFGNVLSLYFFTHIKIQMKNSAMCKVIPLKYVSMCAEVK